MATTQTGWVVALSAVELCGSVRPRTAAPTAAPDVKLSSAVNDACAIDTQTAWAVGNVGTTSAVPSNGGLNPATQTRTCDYNPQRRIVRRHADPATWSAPPERSLRPQTAARPGRHQRYSTSDPREPAYADREPLVESRSARQPWVDHGATGRILLTTDGGVTPGPICQAHRLTTEWLRVRGARHTWWGPSHHASDSQRRVPRGRTHSRARPAAASSG